MDNNQYTAYFLDAAMKHLQLMHGQPVAGNPALQRKSFFAANGEEELRQSVNTQVDYPIFVLLPSSGKLTNNNVINNEMVGRFEIRGKIKNALDFAAMDTERANCYNIGMQIIARMYITALDWQNEGPVPGFDINTVRYSYTGPVNDAEVGCLFTFEYLDEAFNPFDFDLNQYFNEDLGRLHSREFNQGFN